MLSFVDYIVDKIDNQLDIIPARLSLLKLMQESYHEKTTIIAIRECYKSDNQLHMAIKIENGKIKLNRRNILDNRAKCDLEAVDFACTDWIKLY